MRKAATLLLAVAMAISAVAPSAFAAEEKEGHAAKKEGGEGKKEGDAKKGKPGTNVDMPFLMAPLTDADGKLTGYAYLSTRLTATSEGGGTAVRDKLPFIQDIMVRDVNLTSVATAEDLEKVDIVATEKRLLADATKVMGPGKVKLIMICSVNVSPLHPVQTPARDVPPEQMIPAGTTPKNPIKSRCDD
jgi:hypothetical protein